MEENKIYFFFHKVWDILHAITQTKSETVSLNPNHGRPWSSSVLGRPLIHEIVKSCLKIGDIQSAVMIITKMLKYDKNLIPNPATLVRKKSNDLGRDAHQV